MMWRCRGAWRFLDLKDLWQLPANHLETPSFDSLVRWISTRKNMRKTSNSNTITHICIQTGNNYHLSKQIVIILSHNLFMIFWHSDKATIQTATQESASMHWCLCKFPFFDSIEWWSADSKKCLLHSFHFADWIHPPILRCSPERRMRIEPDLNPIGLLSGFKNMKTWTHDRPHCHARFTFTRKHEQFGWFMLRELSTHNTKFEEFQRPLGRTPAGKVHRTP